MIPLWTRATSSVAWGWALLVVGAPWVRDVLPRLTKWFTGSRDAREMMSYYWETIDACVPPDAIVAAMRSVGFADAQRTTELGLFSAFTATRP